MIQKRSLAGILDAAIGLVRSYPWILLGIGLVYEGVPAAVVEHVLPDADANLLSPQFLASALASSVLGSFATYASAWSMFRIAEGTIPSLSEALLAPWRAGLGRIFSLLVFALLTATGLAAYIVPGVLVSVFLLPLLPLLAVEGCTGASAFGRSWALGRCHRLRSLAIVAAIPLLSVPLSLIAGLAAELSTALSAAAWVWLMAVVGALGDAAIFLFYVDLRVRKEAFDLEHLASMVERRTREPSA